MTVLDGAIETYGLLAVFALMFCNGFFSAPPSEMVLPLAGLLALRTDTSIIAAICAAASGNLLGNYLLYVLGQRNGWLLFLRLRAWMLQQRHPMSYVGEKLPGSEDWERLHQWVETGGVIWVGVLRCVPYIRSVVSIPAGMLRMRVVPFLVASGLGVLAWAIIWAGGTYALGEAWLRGAKVTSIGIFSFLLAVFWFLAVFVRRRMRAGGGRAKS